MQILWNVLLLIELFFFLHERDGLHCAIPTVSHLNCSILSQVRLLYDVPLIAIAIELHPLALKWYSKPLNYRTKSACLLKISTIPRPSASCSSALLTLKK